MIFKLIMVLLLLCAALTAVMCIGNAGNSLAIEAWGWVALVLIGVCLGLTVTL